MVSKNGVVFYTQDGGLITQGQTAAKDTRAGGSGSIIALADGVATGKNRSAASTVKIKGNVTAADHVALKDATTYAGLTAAQQAATYNNIGGAALNGGQVIIENAAKATSTIEDATHSNKSLIYGMAAYAIGNNSKVTYKNTANVNVVSGSRGALWAEDNGKIEFNGDITHQNNVGSHITDASGTRFGRGNITNDDIGRSDNDHDLISPFYVLRKGNGNTTGSVSNDTASITFNAATKINMYDGILLNGNVYGNKYENNINGGYAISDYHAKVTDASDKWKAAKYKGMENITANILSDNVVMGIVNQATDEIVWNNNKAGGTGAPTTPSTNFLSGIGAYAGNMKIVNGTGAADAFKLDTTLINGALKISENVNIEDIETTKPTGVTTPKNDAFNYIKMESEKVTNKANITGDAANRDIFGASRTTNYQLNNVGFTIGNSLSRWDRTDNPKPTWRKTKKDESGFTNLGQVDIWGGSKTNSITGLLVNFGTIQNGDGTDKGYVRVDHGNAIVGTDGSELKNLKDSEITVTGKYVKPTTNAPTLGTNGGRGDDTSYGGENYGIVGISDGYLRLHTKTLRFLLKVIKQLVFMRKIDMMLKKLM